MDAPALTHTSDHGYVRLRRTSYGDADLDKWRDRIEATNWKEAYVFFKHEDDASGPAMAAKFLQRLND